MKKEKIMGYTILFLVVGFLICCSIRDHKAGRIGPQGVITEIEGEGGLLKVTLDNGKILYIPSYLIPSSIEVGKTIGKSDIGDYYMVGD